MPAPTNPLGVKPGSEGGTAVSPAAVANAVVDALKPLGVRHIDLPATPERVWRAIQRRGGGVGRPGAGIPGPAPASFSTARRIAARLASCRPS